MANSSYSAASNVTERRGGGLPQGRHLGCSASDQIVRPVVDGIAAQLSYRAPVHLQRTPLSPAPERRRCPPKPPGRPTGVFITPSWVKRLSMSPLRRGGARGWTIRRTLGHWQGNGGQARTRTPGARSMNRLVVPRPISPQGAAALREMTIDAFAVSSACRKTGSARQALALLCPPRALRLAPGRAVGVAGRLFAPAHAVAGCRVAVQRTGSARRGKRRGWVAFTP